MVWSSQRISWDRSTKSSTFCQNSIRTIILRSLRWRRWSVQSIHAAVGDKIILISVNLYFSWQKDPFDQIFSATALTVPHNSIRYPHNIWILRSPDLHQQLLLMQNTLTRTPQNHVPGRNRAIMLWRWFSGQNIHQWFFSHGESFRTNAARACFKRPCEYKLPWHRFRSDGRAFATKSANRTICGDFVDELGDYKAAWVPNFEISEMSWEGWCEVWHEWKPRSIGR